MEVQELIFYYVNKDRSSIEVQFRLDLDSDDEMRVDNINLNEAIDFGYDLLVEDFESDEEEDEDSFWLDSPSIDEESLLSFLNEYYVVNPDKMPKTEFF